jgi:hypothetical protein
VVATLTVEVDGETIRLRFGVGVIRKRIGLAEVRAWQAVRNPWYCGWGIRLGPRGQLWNVSGFDAVELALPEGRRFRIGTDEPHALVSAITQAKGLASAARGGWSPLPRPGSAGSVAVLLPGHSWAGLLVPGQPRGHGGAGFRGRYLFYGPPSGRRDRDLARESWRCSPGRTFAGGHLRGASVSRPARPLYVDEAAPCARAPERRLVIVNFREPERTLALYEEMARAWPDRVSAAAP